MGIKPQPYQNNINIYAGILTFVLDIVLKIINIQKEIDEFLWTLAEHMAGIN